MTDREQKPVSEAAGGTTSQPAALHRDYFLGAVLRGDRVAAWQATIRALDEGLPLVAVYVEVFESALEEVDRLWRQGRISFAARNVASAVTQYVMASLYQRMGRRRVDCGVAVVTGVEGELEQVGVHIVADALEADGWKVHFLGSKICHPEAIDAVCAIQPQLLGIFVASDAHLAVAGRLARSVRERLRGGRPHIMLGGAAFRRQPHHWRWCGGDCLVPTAAAALHFARTLGNRPRQGCAANAPGR